MIRRTCWTLVSLFVVVTSSRGTLAENPGRRESMPPVLLQMMRDDAVHEELKLSDSQIGQVETALRQVDGDWFLSRNFPADKQAAKVSELTVVLDQSLRSILDETQLQRRRQLERQALGTRMVLREDVREGLELTEGQISRFRATFAKTRRETAAIQADLKEKKLEPAAAQQKLNSLRQAEQESVVGALTDVQRGRLGSLTGPTFDFSQVRRSLPSAPEFSADGMTWIQGGPVKLDDLRGKVVAVHFYAYQCINCIQNLPHYSAWHDDYESDGLVVIGIQSPETASERNPNRVAAAVKEKQIRYPVALDLDMTNWKAWGTTMWPSVYLVDKKGYVRKWWYGEMNWQGTEGEKQMRQTIEMLLAED